MDGKDIDTESQEAITEGLLALTTLDKKREIHRGAMADGRYYDSDDECIFRGSMTTEAWHGEIMGLKRGLQARAASKRNKDTDAPNNGSAPGADSNTNSDAEDTRNVNEAPHQATQADTGGVQEE